MKSIFVTVLVLLFAGAVSAQDEKLSVSDVISAQIDAFQVDDFESAFEYATPVIRRIFGNHERFGQMVRNGFPMVWRTSDVRYLETREAGGRLYQKVLVTDADGVFHALEYEMIETENGWQINGVQLLAAPDVGA